MKKTSKACESLLEYINV